MQGVGRSGNKGKRAKSSSHLVRKLKKKKKPEMHEYDLEM